MRIHFENICYNDRKILVEKDSEKFVSLKTTFILKSVVQDGCRTGWIQDRSDAGQIRYRTGRMQDRTDAGQDGCRTGRMKDRTDE